jgi:hypothetical protein
VKLKYIIVFGIALLLGQFWRSLQISVSQESSEGQLTEEQVLALVTSTKLGEVPVNRVVELINQRGVRFSVTDIFLLELKVREADVAIIETLKQLREKGKDFVATPTDATQKPSEPAKTAAPPEKTQSSPEGIPAGKMPTEESWPQFL